MSLLTGIGYEPAKSLVKRVLRLSTPRSVPPAFFETIYRDHADPFNYETSSYEAEKYAHTIAALPGERYASALEIGGSIGVLTAMLASRCASLLSIDVCEQAQARARERCRDLSHVRFAQMGVPRQYPDEMFDLTVFSEVGYYLSRDDLLRTQRQIVRHLSPGGHLLLVHWTGMTPLFPISGADVHACFRAEDKSLRHLTSAHQPGYHLDLFERI